MAFQSSIGAAQAFGVVGERPYGVPARVQPAIIVSGSAANNVAGRACTVTTGATGTPVTATPATDPKPMVVAAGGAGVFAGIIMNPKAYANFSSGLGSTLAVANNSVVELAQEDEIIVSLPAASNVGDVVYYLTADGTLVTAAPGAAKPANTGQYAIGTVERFTGAGAGIAVMRVVSRVGAPAGS